MIFASTLFLGYFLPVVLGVYYLLPEAGRWRNRWLLVASYVFYGWWDPLLLPLLFGLTLWSFGFAWLLGRADFTEGRRKTLLVLGVSGTLVALFFGKYFGFACENYDWLAARLGWDPAPATRWALPLGIPFFTFHAISTLVDVYRRLHPDTTEECYTWWSNRGQARAKNVGWRIDYHLATPMLAELARAESIYKSEKFSDHAPLTIDYDLSL